MIVIPMAGASRRFTDAGYDRPKYMLPLQDRPLFDWAVMSFADAFASERFLFIARDIAGTQAFIRDRLKALGVDQAEVVLLEAPTKGQAETVELGLAGSSVAEDESLTIFNIDTFRPGCDISPVAGASGWLEVFRTTGDNWSFVEPDPADPSRVARCSEKVRISDLCCTGLYVFEQKALFTEALALERETPSSHELFVAPMYNHLIRRGVRIGWRECPEDKVILSGVPAEYEALLNRDIASLYP